MSCNDQLATVPENLPYALRSLLWGTSFFFLKKAGKVDVSTILTTRPPPLLAPGFSVSMISINSYLFSSTQSSLSFFCLKSAHLYEISKQ